MYDPPIRSKPKLTFLSIRLLVLRFKVAKKIANSRIRYIEITLIFVKLSTKKNYLTSVFFSKLVIVDLII